MIFYSFIELIINWQKVIFSRYFLFWNILVYNIKIIIYFTIHKLIKLLKFDFDVIFIVLFGVYKVSFINFNCGLDITLLNISKVLRKYRYNYTVK